MAQVNGSSEESFGSTGAFFPVTGAGKHYHLPLRDVILVGLVTIIVVRTIIQKFNGVKAPFAGYRSMLEPGFLVRLRFSRGALPIINEGFQKFKNSMFKLSRNDRDILVLSNKYVDELRSLPDEKLSSIQALLANLVGKYSATNILLESDLHTKILQTKLTPNLATFTGIMKDELDYAISMDIPECEDHWARVHIYDILLKIVARISNRVFLGQPVCRNEEWLKTSIDYSANVTKTVMVLRMFPPVLHPVVAMFLPSAWAIPSHLKTAKRILIPIMEARREAEKNEPGYQKPSDLFQWMMDAANENDSQPDKMAHRQLIMSLASVHTTTMAAAHALYDMCAMPEYFEHLREEVLDVLREDGGLQKTSLNKMRKMDSFLKESQRMSPASLLGFHRIVQTPITLHDGVRLPAGTHLCIASYPTLLDSSFASNAKEFDGFRYYKKRQEVAEAQKHQYAMTDKNHLHFGHGKFACPGRFFASNELKMILVVLLLKYDFKFPEGQGRPANLNADEFLYADPAARLMMKRRGVDQSMLARVR